MNITDPNIAESNAIERENIGMMVVKFGHALIKVQNFALKF